MFTLFVLTTEELQNKNSKIESLLSLIATGNKNSFSELYELIKVDVFAYALSKLKSKTDAEDVMHDTLVNVYKYAKKYTPKGKPMAWIITIEQNVIRRFFELRNRTAELSDKVINTHVCCEFEDTLIKRTFIRQMLSILSAEEREIITLHVVSGLKHREIARLTQKPLSTILSKYNRAIKKLKNAVKED